MKGLIRLLLFVSVMSAVQLSAQSAQETPFSLTISTPQQVVKAGSEIKVDVVLRNTSDHEIALLRSPGTGRGELEFESDVVSEKGNPASQTKYGQHLRKSGLGAVEGSRIMFRLLSKFIVKNFHLRSRGFASQNCKVLTSIRKSVSIPALLRSFRHRSADGILVRVLQIAKRTPDTFAASCAMH